MHTVTVYHRYGGAGSRYYRVVEATISTTGVHLLSTRTFHTRYFAERYANRLRMQGA